MRTFLFSGFLLLTLATLAGCAGLPVEDAKNRLKTQQNCCKDFNEISFLALPIGSRQSLVFNIDSPVFATQHGNAFFSAFQLPSSTPKSLEIESYYGEILSKASYVDPVVIFLDAQKNVITDGVQPPLKRAYRTTFPGFFKWHFGATIDIPVNSSYVVIYAHPASLRQQLAVSDNGTNWPLSAAPIGEIGLKLVQ